MSQDRLFIGIFPGGVSYADRSREVQNDYARLAFLPYDTLALDVRPECPDDLRARIEADAAELQARRGEQFQISACGHTVLLGSALAPA